jgi:hypothetical protein
VGVVDEIDLHPILEISGIFLQLPLELFKQGRRLDGGAGAEVEDPTTKTPVQRPQPIGHAPGNLQLLEARTLQAGGDQFAVQALLDDVRQ